MIHFCFSDRASIAASVKFSHHIFWWLAGSHSRTVRTELRRRTPCSAQSVRLVFSRLIPISDSSSLKILRRLGCGFDHSGIENESHIAAGMDSSELPTVTNFSLFTFHFSLAKL